MQLIVQCNFLNYVTRVQLSDETRKDTILKQEDPRVHDLPPTHIEDMQDDLEYYEFTRTLMELHSFCMDLPEDGEDVVVFYLHSKSHDTWRRWMESYLIGKQCVKCLEDETKMAWYV